MYSGLDLGEGWGNPVIVENYKDEHSDDNFYNILLNILLIALKTTTKKGPKKLGSQYGVWKVEESLRNRV